MRTDKKVVLGIAKDHIYAFFFEDDFPQGGNVDVM